MNYKEKLKQHGHSVVINRSVVNGMHIVESSCSGASYNRETQWEIPEADIYNYWYNYFHLYNYRDYDTAGMGGTF